MNGNPLYRNIDSLVFLVEPDAVLLELRPNKLYWQFTLVRMRNRGAPWWPGPYSAPNGLWDRFRLTGGY